MSVPQTPYTTDGMPAKMSNMGNTIRFTHELAYSVRKMAESKEMGNAMAIDKAVTKSVPTINGRNPNSPLRGFHADPESSSHRECSDKIRRLLKNSPIPMAISNNSDNTVRTSMTHRAALSLNMRRCNSDKSIGDVRD